MTCTNADGKLTESATTVLKTLKQEATPPEIAAATGLSLCVVRRNLHELVKFGLVLESEGKYRLSVPGQERISKN